MQIISDTEEAIQPPLSPHGVTTRLSLEIYLHYGRLLVFNMVVWYIRFVIHELTWLSVLKILEQRGSEFVKIMIKEERSASSVQCFPGWAAKGRGGGE